MEDKASKQEKRVKFGLMIQPELYAYIRDMSYQRRQTKSAFLEVVIEGDKRRRLAGKEQSND